MILNHAQSEFYHIFWSHASAQNRYAWGAGNKLGINYEKNFMFCLLLIESRKQIANLAGIYFLKQSFTHW